MYMLGSYIVTKYAGMPYPEFVKTRIWDPLNMSDTTLYESEASRHGKLSQVWAFNGRRIPIWMLDEQISLNAGAGGVISSAVDMVGRMFSRRRFMADVVVDQMASHSAQCWGRSHDEQDNHPQICIRYGDHGTDPCRLTRSLARVFFCGLWDGMATPVLSRA